MAYIFKTSFLLFPLRIKALHSQGKRNSPIGPIWVAKLGSPSSSRRWRWFLYVFLWQNEAVSPSHLPTDLMVYHGLSPFSSIFPYFHLAIFQRTSNSKPWMDGWPAILIPAICRWTAECQDFDRYTHSTRTIDNWYKCKLIFARQ